MNQGKLEAVKQEMAGVNVDILGVSKLKWTGMGEFNSDDHYTYHCGQESLCRNGVAITVNKRVRNTVLGFNLKNNRMISVCLQGKAFNIRVIQVYAPTSNAEKTEVERFYEDLQDLLFYFIFNFYFYFILLYNTVLVLPYIDMNSPRVSMHSQT